MKTDSQVDRIHFDVKIVDLVNNYIENASVYPEDSCIAIQNRSLEIELLTAQQADKKWKLYPIVDFLRQNENNNGLEADIDATWSLSAKYYFVR